MGAAVPRVILSLIIPSLELAAGEANGYKRHSLCVEVGFAGVAGIRRWVRVAGRRRAARTLVPAGGRRWPGNVRRMGHGWDRRVVQTAGPELESSEMERVRHRRRNRERRRCLRARVLAAPNSVKANAPF